MSAEQSNINCPQCGHEYNVEAVISRQLEEKYRKQLGDTLKKKEAEMKAAADAQNELLQKKELELRAKEQEMEKVLEARVLAVAKAKEAELKEKLQQEHELYLKSLKEAAEEDQVKIRALQQTSIENEKLKRQLQEQEQLIQLQYEKKMTETLQQKAEEMKKQMDETAAQKLKEKETVIEQLRTQMSEMQRRADQGSMQLQGEVQEQILEEILGSLFPFDIIGEVGKGVRGADVVHTVRNHLGMECGRIAYESKRTKSWSNDWIKKIKDDVILVKADIMVIVTETMPPGMDKMGQIDGVWVCNFSDFKGMAHVLRDSLIRIQQAYNSQLNKGDKMQMLYDYLTGSEFRMQMNSIVHGFNLLKAGYEKEKQAMHRIWKEREKQLESILLNTNDFLGSVSGIAGNSITGIDVMGPENLIEG